MAKSHFDEIYAEYKTLPITVRLSRFILRGAVALGTLLTDKQRKVLTAEVLAEADAFDLSRYAFLAAILAEGDASPAAKQIIAEAKSCLALVLLRKSI